MSKILRFSFVALLVLAMSAIAFGQGTVTGAIAGVVTNEAKEVVPGATITVKNLGTNKEDTATADDQGRFRIGNLEPGTYSVTINSTGFSAFTAEKVTVEVGASTGINATLSVGPLKPNEVLITTDAPVINTSQQDFSSNVNQTQISNLPINGARWSNFVLLNPGSTPDGNFGLISFRGISGLLNNNTVDGGDNNQAFFSEEKGRTRLSYTTSPGGIREFQVNTSNYSAEYGRAAGAVVNAVTKSGSNEFHGTAEYFQRNNKWGARNPLGTISTFNSTTRATTISPFKPEDVRHTVRGSIGGPIVKDKAFFFFSFDEQRRNFPGLAIFASPSFLGTVNTCASATDPNGPNGAPCTATLFGTSLKKANTALTDTQINAGLAFLNNQTGPVPRKGNQRIFFPKVDWHLNSNNVFTASYNRLKWVSPAGIQTQPTNSFGRTSFGDDFVNADSLNLRLSSTFGATMVNELRFQWARDNEFEFSQTPLAGEALTAPGYPGVTTAGTRGPDVTLFSAGGTEWGTSTFLERPKFPFETRKQIADTVTLTAGNHTIKWGGDFNNVLDVQDNLRLFAGSYGYSNINDFIVDYVNSTSGLGAGVVCSTTTRLRGRCYTSNFTQGFGPTQFQFTTQDINIFVQDEWRYTPRLTVNFGARYEYERLPNPFLASNVPQTASFPKDKNNVGPRIGFAWDMSGDSKNSLRGGYGIYFGRIINSTILNALTNTGNAGGQIQTSTAPASGPIFPNVLTSAPAGTAAIQFFQNHFQAPLIHQMDIIYEREVAKNTVASVSMLMSFARNLPTFVDTNLRLPTGTSTYAILDGPFSGQNYTVPLYTGTRPVTAYGAMTEIRSTVSSRYYGFVLQLNKRLTHTSVGDLQFQGSYTRSRAHDTGQTSTTFTATNSPFDPANPLAEEGISNYDIPNKFTANAVYAPHFNSGGPVLNGWQIAPIVTMYSGVPFTPGITGSNPNTTTAGGQNGSGGSARFAFVPRNSYRLPKIVNFDMRISRRFKFNESTSLEFLVEGFNLMNRTQVTGLNTTLYRTGGTAAAPTLTFLPAFGTVTAAGGTLYRERQVQLAARFQF